MIEFQNSRACSKLHLLSSICPDLCSGSVTLCGSGNGTMYVDILLMCAHGHSVPITRAVESRFRRKLRAPGEKIAWPSQLLCGGGLCLCRASEERMVMKRCAAHELTS